ncbi:MAG: aminotransferase class I/II-fold pyridoxal phosphate-dependent enzyme [Calditrichaeota bacterium]|nr:aminotransferase class I/II-fold pyridoxal phosphate-dependent enzyme [Calditrichota bacterium]
MLIDLRSDTVTRPTPAMRQAISAAEVGDDVFGDDPTVIKLQELTADLLGKEAALFFPSGTMSNQSAIAAHTSPGDEIYADIGCHIFNYEAGAPAALSGVMIMPLQGHYGVFTAGQVEERLRPPDSHFPQSRLIWVENTHNRSGGTIFPQEEALRLQELAVRKGLKMHLDGARIWNAAAALHISERELAALFDSVSCCLSKGLGCPVGSLLCGSSEFIRRAHRFRKRFGGGMRQAGILAAAGIYALENHRTRLVEDHRRAKRLAEAIAKLSTFNLELDFVHTNIVIFDVTPGGFAGSQVTALLKAEDVFATAFGPKVRMVTHLDISDDDIDKTIAVLNKLFK